MGMSLKSRMMISLMAIQAGVAVALLLVILALNEAKVPGSVGLSLWDAIAWMSVVVICGWMLLGQRITLLKRELANISDKLGRGRGQALGRLLTVDPPEHELRQLVAAVNTVLEQHASQHAHAVELIDRLRNEAYHDATTNLANRRAFHLKVDSLMSDGEALGSGVMLMMRIDGLKDYNMRVGMAAGDRMLAGCAEVLKKVEELKQSSVIGSEAMLARLNGAEFVWLCPTAEPASARARAAILAERLQQFVVSTEATLAVRACIIHYRERRQVVSLWSKADEILRQAKPSHDVEVVELPVSEVGTGRAPIDWTRLLPLIIEQRQIMLVAQPVMAAGKDRVLHREVFSRLLAEDGEVVTASLFLPQIERLSLTTRFDQLVVETVLNWLDNQAPTTEQLAINLSPESVVNGSFREFLMGALRIRPRAATSLVFEVHEIVLRRTPDAVRQFAAELRTVGAGFAIDHFGVGRATLASLKGIALDYVKIDAGYVRGVLFNDEHRSSIKLIVDVARQNGARTIAESVETREEFDTLVMLGVDGLRGYFCGGVVPLQNTA